MDLDADNVDQSGFDGALSGAEDDDGRWHDGYEYVWEQGHPN